MTRLDRSVVIAAAVAAAALAVPFAWAILDAPLAVAIVCAAAVLSLGTARLLAPSWFAPRPEEPDAIRVGAPPRR